MSAGRAFFDTNVLLYMHSAADLQKQIRAQNLFEEYLFTGRLLLSTQVVQEFYAAGLRKLAIPRRELRSLASAYLELPLIRIGPDHIRQALNVEEQYQISFWDALIVAAAEAGGAQVLFTEDLNPGQVYGTVRVENPFSTDSQVTSSEPAG